MKQLFVFLISALILISCSDFHQAVSDSGVQKASIKVNTDPSGHTVEQKNYMEKTQRDNQLGSIKHLYIVSAYTGDILEYSTVAGKVTSGSKRLSPTTVQSGSATTEYNYVIINNARYLTTEIPDEYGMYGPSGNYFYWFDTQGNMHQYYPSGGTYVHILDKPLKVKKASMIFE